jgi:hypothetical protein
MPSIQLEVGSATKPDTLDVGALDVTIAIDPADLGRYVAKLGSPEQAEFILGFYEEIVSMQMAYIGTEPIFDTSGTRADVASVIKDLAEFISHPRGESQ